MPYIYTLYTVYILFSKNFGGLRRKICGRREKAKEGTDD
jgi:hypothetical protein